MEGHGEAVCFIVNDLTNRELIRRKFSFVQPNIHNAWDNSADYDDYDEQSLIQGSTVFDVQAATDLQNHINLKLNEKALKTSKDITVTNNMTKKQIFDMINANDEDHSLSDREAY